MRRCAGYSLLELMVGMGVALGILAVVLALASSAQADSRQQGVTQAVLSVASAAMAQAEYEGLGASGGTAALLVSRTRDLAPMLSADSTYFDAGHGVRITPAAGVIVVTGLDAAECANVALASASSVPGIAGVRVNATTGAYLDANAPSAAVAACGLASPAYVRVEL